MSTVPKNKEDQTIREKKVCFFFTVFDSNAQS